MAVNVCYLAYYINRHNGLPQKTVEKKKMKEQKNIEHTNL